MTSGWTTDLPEGATHAERLQSMIDQCLPTTPALEEDWVLWVELWLRAVRHPELRPVAEELYARMRAWFADEITAGIRDGEFQRCDPEEVADRTLALLDGFGVRTLIGDSTIPLERARRSVSAALAAELGLGERLVSGDGALVTTARRSSAARPEPGERGKPASSVSVSRESHPPPGLRGKPCRRGALSRAFQVPAQTAEPTSSAARAAPRPVRTAPSM